MAAAPSPVSLKPVPFGSVSFAKIPCQASIAAASRVGLCGMASKGRKGGAIRAPLFLPKLTAAKDVRPAKVLELYVYEVNEHDRKSLAYLSSALSRPRTLRQAWGSLDALIG